MADTSLPTYLSEKQMDPMSPDKTNPAESAITPPDLTAEELHERSFDLNKLFAISQIRESPHPQFDGMGYMKYNETNEMADMSFIAPKKNKYDTRVTSGITHEKDTFVTSLINSFKFEPQLTVFYKDQEMPEFSTSATGWVRKTWEIDHMEEKDPIFIRQLIVQGTATAQVRHVQRYVPLKVFSNETDNYAGATVLKWQNMGFKKTFDGTCIDLVDGKKIFYEDFYQSDIRKQVGIYTVEYIPQEMVESVWKNSPRWQNVPKKCAPNGTIGAMVTQGSIYSDWFFITLDFDKVEVIQAIRQFENRYQIYLNGIPMLPGGFPLTAISPAGQAFIAKGDIDPMNMCAYSKGIPAKTKMDQAMYDALLRIALIKFEQSAFPPTGNNSGRLLSPDIFMPSKVTRNLKKSDIDILTENAGLQPQDFQFVNMIKEQIDNKSVASILENGMGAESGPMTLGQYLDQQKRQLVKLGGVFDGVINWKKQMAHLTLMDCLYNYDYDNNVAMKDTFADGTKGTTVMRFNKKNNAPSSDLHEEENEYKKQTGKDVRYADYDPDELKAMVGNPDYYWYWEIVPVDKNNDKITQAFFVSMIGQAAQLFGMDSMKVQNLKQEYAKVMGKQFDDLFVDQATLDLQKQEAMAATAPPTMPSKNAPAPNANANGGGNVPSGFAMPSSSKTSSFYQ